MLLILERSKTQAPWIFFMDGIVMLVDGSGARSSLTNPRNGIALSTSLIFKPQTTRRMYEPLLREYDLQHEWVYQVLIGDKTKADALSKIDPQLCAPIKAGVWLNLENKSFSEMEIIFGDREQDLIHRPIPRQPQQELTPITSPWPFHKWGIDIAGPFPVAAGGLKFLIVAIDYFTKWIEARAVATITGNQTRMTSLYRAKRAKPARKTQNADTKVEETYEVTEALGKASIQAYVTWLMGVPIEAGPTCQHFLFMQFLNRFRPLPRAKAHHNIPKGLLGPPVIPKCSWQSKERYMAYEPPSAPAKADKHVRVSVLIILQY
ncbi:reverse transcriptase domain-containing protein [Tanacetum coccineum]